MMSIDSIISNCVWWSLHSGKVSLSPCVRTSVAGHRNLTLSAPILSNFPGSATVPVGSSVGGTPTEAVETTALPGP
jgi:hypothetical protein